MINVEQYIPLANKIAGVCYRKYKLRYEYEDLLQVGYVGLMKASKMFDATKGTKFMTFAYNFILREILKYVRDDKWFLAKNRDERKYNAQAPGSLDICVGEKKDTPIVEFMSTEDAIPDLDLQIAIENLPEGLNSIIKLKYFYGYSQKEIGNKLDISQPQASRREKKALNMLKEVLQGEHLCTA